jgi:hypothetical protein
MSRDNNPWELLREARNELAVLASYVGHPDTKWPTVGLMLTAVAQKKLHDRIDAALAEHNSTTDIVEWNKVNENFSTAYPDIQTSLTVSRFDLTQQKWRWDAEVEIKKAGYCDTEEEAKAAALKAARGLK